MRLLFGLALVLVVGSSGPAGKADAARGEVPQRERLDRGLIARSIKGGKVYVGWRLLDGDPTGVAFNLYRRDSGKEPLKLNADPLRKTTDFIDPSPGKAGAAWFIRPVADGKEGPPSEEAGMAGDAEQPGPHLSVKLDGNHTFQKVGIADLDGDRRYDFVIKQPNANIDPYVKYWKPSVGTYKLEAYRSDGKFLWRFDLGWAIEQGIWYSPYLVYDLDGDGKAEVAVKTGAGDPRDKGGKVQSGPEYLTILDGRTGKPITKVDWPSREGVPSADPSNYSSYNSRNQMCVAYLDGKRPSLIVERGTRNRMKAVAYRFKDGRLHEQWRWDNRKKPKKYWGQGAHWMHAVDLDGDGRDEIVLGSSVLDHDGRALWSTGLGHPDHCYVGHIDPSRTGLQIYYGLETPNPKNAMCLVDARTGEILWGHDQPTKHIHNSGLCSDIDPTHPGSECYSGEARFKDQRWLRDCKGKQLPLGGLSDLAPRAVYWDADPQRELLVRGRVFKYKLTSADRSDKGVASPYPKIGGSVIAVADILGDWREEIITSLPGELRIYTTTIPATDRRICLMQDPLYRMDVVCAAMGYFQVPMTSYDVATEKRYR